jgi:hypothetical protein
VSGRYLSFAEREDTASWPATTWAVTVSTVTSKRPRAGPQFLEFCRYLRSLYSPEVRIAIVLDNFSPHLSTKTDIRWSRWIGWCALLTRYQSTGFDTESWYFVPPAPYQPTR